MLSGFENFRNPDENDPNNGGRREKCGPNVRFCVCDLVKAHSCTKPRWLSKCLASLFHVYRRLDYLRRPELRSVTVHRAIVGGNQEEIETTWHRFWRRRWRWTGQSTQWPSFNRRQSLGFAQTQEAARWNQRKSHSDCFC